MTLLLYLILLNLFKSSTNLNVDNESVTTLKPLTSSKPVTLSQPDTPSDKEMIVEKTTKLNFDNGLVIPSDKEVVVEKTQLSVLVNFTLPKIDHRFDCLKNSDFQDKISTINVHIQSQFDEILRNLNLFVPTKLKYIVHFCNCYNEPIFYTGDPALSCCSRNKHSDADVKKCVHDLEIKQYFDNHDSNHLSSKCIRLPLLKGVQIFRKDYFINTSLNVYQQKLLTSNTPSFSTEYLQTGITPYLTYNVNRLTDGNLDTYHVFDVDKFDYVVKYTFTDHWLLNPGYETVAVIVGHMSPKINTPKQIREIMNLFVTYNDNQNCTFVETDLFKNYRSYCDFSSLIFKCPKENMKHLKVTFSVTNYSLRIHDIGVIRSSVDDVIKSYSANMQEKVLFYKTHGKDLISTPNVTPLTPITSPSSSTQATSTSTSTKAISTSSSSQAISSKTEETLPLNPPTIVNMNENDNNDDSESVLPLNPPIFPVFNYDDITDDEDLIKELTDSNTQSISTMTVNDNLMEELSDTNISYVEGSANWIDIDTWNDLTKNGNIIIEPEMSINHSLQKRSLHSLSNFWHYWSRGGPITNSYNSQRLDLNKHKIEKMNKMVLSNSNMIWHLTQDAEVKMSNIAESLCAMSASSDINVLKLQAELAMFELKSDVNELIDSCRLNIMPSLLLEKLGDFCSKDKSCDTYNKLINCQIEGLGVTHEHGKQLHINVIVNIPKSNNIKSFEIIPLPILIDYHTLSYIPNIKEKNFDFATSTIMSLPKYIFIREDSKNTIVGFSNSSDTFVDINELSSSCITLNDQSLSSGHCVDNTKFDFIKSTCLITKLPQLNVLHLLASKEIRIFNNDHTFVKKNCTKECFLHVNQYTPDCFHNKIIRNNFTQIETSVELTESINQLQILDKKPLLSEIRTKLLNDSLASEKEIFIKNLHEFSKPILQRKNFVFKTLLFVTILILTTVIIVSVWYVLRKFYFVQNQISRPLIQRI